LFRNVLDRDGDDAVAHGDAVDRTVSEEGVDERRGGGIGDVEHVDVAVLRAFTTNNCWVSGSWATISAADSSNCPVS
jgi:hypothetical protein